MRSAKAKPLDSLERDLETTLADIEALRRAASIGSTDPFAAVQALIDALPAAARRQRRETASGRPEFVL